MSTTFKIVILGDSAVGKTSFLNQYCFHSFSNKTKSTLGIDFILTEVQVNEQIITIQLWDTAGSEKFSSLAPMFLRNVHACILMCDLTNRASLQALTFWRNELFDALHISDAPLQNSTHNSIHNSTQSFDENMKEFPMIIVGNKADCENERVISSEELKQWDGGKHVVIETSAKTGLNVNFIIEELAKLLVFNYPGEFGLPFVFFINFY